MNYYYLVAGLPDLHQEDSKGVPALEVLKSELKEQLTVSDNKLLNLLFYGYDNQNLLLFIKNREAALNPLANITHVEWENLFELIKEENYRPDKIFLPYLLTYINTNFEEEIVGKGITPEDYLAGLYYEFAMKSDNKFLCKWFEFNLDINNMLTAIACRKHNLDSRQLVIGHNEIAKTLRHSHARDLGISALFEYYDVVYRIAEESDLLEREKKIDALKWNWLEENTFYHYFSIERILAYVLRVEMLERWKLLSVEAGTQIFRELLLSLKKGIEIKE
jgi:hypothetical protein